MTSISRVSNTARLTIFLICIMGLSLTGAYIFLSESSISLKLPRALYWTSSKQTTLVLGVASQVYVVSLPRRTDRRATMEQLRVALGLKWTYVDAVDASDRTVDAILRHVRAERVKVENGTHAFKWPEDVNFVDNVPFELIKGADLWGLDGPDPPQEDTTHSAPPTCAVENNTIPVYAPDLPFHRLLSRGMIACWHSHLAVIRRAAITQNTGDVVVVLEDDIDMEWDISERLRGMWGALPSDWDLVMFGHCWSEEGQLPALNGTMLHPSSAPKCTHAYALSRAGARRLLTHLRHPPFAYSRALDQAIAFLVSNGHIRSFSVVPSVVVQTKVGKSDIVLGDEGKGSTWRERLEDSALERIQRGHGRM